MNESAPRGNSYSIGLIFGALGSIGLIAASYLGYQVADFPFVPFDIFDWMTRILPGSLVTAGIDTMILLIREFPLGPTDQAAKIAEQVFAIIIFVLLGIAAGGLLALIVRRTGQSATRTGVLFGLVFSVPILLIEFSLGLRSETPLIEVLWLMFLFAAWGGVVGLGLQERPQESAEEPGAVSRRSFLYLLGSSLLAISAGLIGLGRLFESDDVETVADPQEVLDIEGITGTKTSPSTETLSERIDPAPGTRPELTANEDFYRIDINTRSPRIDEAEWRFHLDGLVRNPLALSLNEIRSRPSIAQVITLQCISNPIGGDLTGTSVWKGVPLKELLQEAEVLPDAKEVSVEAADGFYESVAMEDMMDERTLLVYEMNGVPLPIEHGFPLRIYIPNRYGMKQPKWIERMTVIGEEGKGYWVDRGWSPEAIVNTTSVIDAVAADGNLSEGDMVPVGGIAYAGARGIDRVEVRVDDGPWVEAQLRVPPLSSLSWVQWRYDWSYAPGRHKFQVRAYDGNGELQELESRGSRPDGATGVHEVDVNI
ncbi:MAG: molybdopterin-dependent oxidoreductase [Anaerolineales bacterium]|nr:molybdopterin-dependent oxidoreductase [Anaerolineales bacterium]